MAFARSGPGVVSRRDGKLYKGFTKDLKARIKEHNKGSVAFYKVKKALETNLLWSIY